MTMGASALRHVGLGVLLAGAGWTARAEPGPAPAPVVVVVDGDSRPYKQALAGVTKLAPQARSIPVEQARAAVSGASPGTRFVGLGPRSARLLAEVRPGRASAALVRAAEAPAGIDVIDLEVSEEVQVGWLKRAFPGRRRLVVLRQPGGALLDADLRAAAEKHGMAIDLVDVSRPGEAVYALERALRRERQGAVVWLLADPVVVTGDTVTPLTQVALAARVPVVGFSSYFLKAGALGAVRTDFGKMGEAAFALTDPARSGATPARHAPPGAHLALNVRLAERLGIALGSGPGLERVE